MSKAKTHIGYHGKSICRTAWTSIITWLAADQYPDHVTCKKCKKLKKALDRELNRRPHVEFPDLPNQLMMYSALKRHPYKA